jgi:hypothetical protein
MPLCFAQKTELAADILSSGLEHGGGRNAIEKDRVCDSFTAWIPGFTPKEHREMYNHLEMRKWQAEQEKDSRAWHAERENASRAWQSSESKKNRTANLCTALIAAIVSAFFGGALGVSLTYLNASLARHAPVDEAVMLPRTPE